MTTTFYRAIACVGLLAGLASCHRATYSFSSQPAYAAAPAVVLAAVPNSPTALPTPHQSADVASPARSARHRALRTQPITQATRPLARQLLGAALPPRRARPAARHQQNTAASGALVPSSAFDGLAAIAILYSLLFLALLGGAIVLLVKLVTHLVNHSSRKASFRAAPRPAP